MTDNRRINSIDIARLFAAILVVAIHTQAITWFSSYSNGNIQILTRVAVPFFFCTSGYFLRNIYIYIYIKRRTSDYSSSHLENCQIVHYSITGLFYCNFPIASSVTARIEEMDADGLSVQWQLLPSVVYGRHYLFHGNNRPDLQTEADESLASIGSHLLYHWSTGDIVLWHWQQAARLKCAV